MGLNPMTGMLIKRKERNIGDRERGRAHKDRSRGWMPSVCHRQPAAPRNWQGDKDWATP